MLVELLPGVALVGYLLATVMVLSRLVHPQGPNYKLMFSAALIAIVCHMLFLADSIFASSGQNFSLLNVISLVCWLISTAITVTALRTPTVLLLPIVYGFSALTQLAVLALPTEVQMQHFEQNPILLMHIIVAFVAYTLLNSGHFPFSASALHQ